jgi:phage gp29-like protein
MEEKDAHLAAVLQTRRLAVAEPGLADDPGL